MALVEDIMDMSRFQFGKFETVLSWFNFHELVEEVFEIVRFLANQKGVKLLKQI